MKAKTISLLTLALLPAVLFTLTSCSSTPQPPPAVGKARIDYTKGVPGGVIFQTFKTAATVTALDPTKHRATFMAPDGKKFTVTVLPEVMDLDQTRVGERVTATVTQKIVARIDDDGASAGDRTAAASAETAQVTAKVIAINPEQRTTTLKFENGTTEVFPIREDVDLSRRKVGELVVFRVTEMTAIRVEKL